MRAGAARLAAASALLLVTVAGCGGSSVDAYCAQLKQDRPKIADIVASGSPTALLSNLPLLRELASKAPEDLADEWQTFIGALEGLDKALDRAGVKPSAFDGGKPPAGLSTTDRRRIVGAAEQIQTQDVVDASSGIEQQGRDVCKVNIGL